jgi:glycosyltransferase involved in cell wall biosynthesis
MIKNKFIILSTCYNVEQWVRTNLEILRAQSYKNFIAVYVNDKSSDSTPNIIQEYESLDSRFHKIDNYNNGSQSKAYMCGLDWILRDLDVSDNDIIVEIDGDDWLSSVFVLDYLNLVYQNPNIWMTFGQYQIFPTGATGGHYDMLLAPTTECRLHPFAYSHLKTYKLGLLKKVNRNDLINPATNEYYSAAWDHVLCIPMVEMAGNNKIHRCEDVLYILNRHPELQNEGSINTSTQKLIEQQIRNKNSYELIYNL